MLPLPSSPEKPPLKRKALSGTIIGLGSDHLHDADHYLHFGLNCRCTVQPQFVAGTDLGEWSLFELTDEQRAELASTLGIPKEIIDGLKS